MKSNSIKKNKENVPGKVQDHGGEKRRANINGFIGIKILSNSIKKK